MDYHGLPLGPYGLFLISDGIASLLMSDRGFLTGAGRGATGNILQGILRMGASRSAMSNLAPADSASTSTVLTTTSAPPAAATARLFLKNKSF